MDTTYIKMCEKAEKMQDKWKPADWDYAYCFTSKEVVVLSGYSTDGGYYGHQTPSKDWCDYYTGSCDQISSGNYKANHIWLPLQGQLQKMSELSWREFDRLCQIYNEPTKEQAGIKAVMWEKYSKKWDGDKWNTVKK